eukprot:19787-Heterococcus_DN1.PRE.1
MEMAIQAAFNNMDCSFVHLLFVFIEQVKISDWLMPDRVDHIMEFILKMMSHPRSVPAQVANVIDCMIGALSADITSVEGTDSSGTPQLVMTTASKGYTA